MGSAVAVAVSTTETLTTPSGAPVYTETTRTVELSPEIRKVTFHGPDVDEQMKDFECLKTKLSNLNKKEVDNQIKQNEKINASFVINDNSLIFKFNKKEFKSKFTLNTERDELGIYFY